MSTPHLSLARSLDHETIVGDRVEARRDVFCEVVGLIDRHRPPFAAERRWVYADGRPAIHQVKQMVASLPDRAASRIDHLALHVQDGRQWDAWSERMQASRLSHAGAIVPQAAEQQLFVESAPNGIAEFVAAVTAAEARQLSNLSEGFA